MACPGTSLNSGIRALVVYGHVALVCASSSALCVCVVCGPIRSPERKDPSGAWVLGDMHLEGALPGVWPASGAGWRWRREGLHRSWVPRWIFGVCGPQLDFSWITRGPRSSYKHHFLGTSTIPWKRREWSLLPASPSSLPIFSLMCSNQAFAATVPPKSQPWLQSCQTQWWTPCLHLAQPFSNDFNHHSILSLITFPHHLTSTLPSSCFYRTTEDQSRLPSFITLVAPPLLPDLLVWGHQGPRRLWTLTPEIITSRPLASNITDAINILTLIMSAPTSPPWPSSNHHLHGYLESICWKLNMSKT